MIDVTDQQRVMLLRKELALERRKLKLRQENGLAFYRPHKKQQLFHSMAHKRYRFARTGNRFGKSEMGAAEDCAFALGERSWLDRHDPMRYHGIPNQPTKGVILCTDWEKTTEVFTNLDSTAEIGKLFKFLPSESIKQKTKNSTGHVTKIIVGRTQGSGESVIHFDTVKSFKGNELGQESSAWDWIHVDEPIPKEMFVANARGCVDRNGKIWFTCTPLRELWINDMFVPSRKLQVSDDLPSIDVGDKFMLTGSIRDNPYNTEEAIAAFESILSADEIQCRLNGIPLALAGLVYKEFDWNIHVLETAPHGWADIMSPPLDYTIRFAVDPHPKKPHAVLFVATSPLGYNFFYSEIFDDCLIRELCDQIKQRLGPRLANDALVDPIANTENPITGTTMRDEFDSNDVFLLNAVKDPSYGILKTKDLLKARDPQGLPWAFFGENLTRTLWEFDHFLWDDKSGKPVKENDDMMEDLYRLVLTGLNYVEPDDSKPFVDRSVDTIETFDRSDLVLDFNESTNKPLNARQKRRRAYNDVY